MNWYEKFFLIGQMPANAMTGTFSPTLVLLSYFIACFASFVALDMSSHLKQRNSIVFKICWLSGGALVMGAGIWSMHFVGMLAYHMDMPMSYDMFWTGLSMVVAAITAGIAFMFFMIKRPHTIHYILSGIILGAAIPTMHYTGMAGMNNVDIRYIPSIFALSILIAIVAATAALWLAVHTDRGTYAKRIKLKIISALIMGLAIAGMHYVGMAAAVMTHNENMVNTTIAADPIVMSILITTVVFSTMCIALILSSTRYYLTTRLQNEKDFLEVVLNSIDASVLAFDSDQKLRLYNNVAKRYFNNIESLSHFSADWIHKLPFFKMDGKTAYNLTNYPLNSVFQGKKLKNIEAIIRNNDKEYILSIYGESLVSQEEEYLGVVVVCQDITERRKIDQMKNEFISTVSHELRTPLTSIRGSLGLITSGAMGNVPAEMASLLDIACNNSERLVRLINDILDTEKIESGKMIFHFTKSDLGSVVEQAVAANKAYADKYHVSYEIKTLLPNSIINMDPDRIRQVLDNLLSNAAKFSKTQGKIIVTMEKHGDKFYVAIEDSGMGIPVEFQSKIFSKFYQVDSSDGREKGGTGLGLSICKSIIDSHNGVIGFKSTPNTGTTFYFELPEAKIESPSNLEFVAATESHKKILICEDEPDVSKLLGLILRERGFNSKRVGTIAEAKKALTSENFSLMTLDLLLPDGNGLDLLRWMREKSELEKLPVVIISAISIEQEKVNGYALGIVDWINKPIDEQRLYKDVAQALGAKNSSKKSKVLHIEDDQDVAKIVATVIANMCITDVANNISKAKKMLNNNSYDLIILDLNLNGESGYDMLAYLEELGYRLPVVILSVDEPHSDINRNIAASLIKSKVSNNDLLDKIVAIIEKSKPNE